jgi:hypothetical protein
MDTKKNHKLKILPVKGSNSKKQFPQIPDPLLQPPFTVAMIAPTKSGKSTTIVNMLKNVCMGYCDDVFETIYYISPTVGFDKTLSSIASDEEIIKISDEDDLNHLDDILGELIKSQKQKDSDDRGHILIILDDCLDYLKKSKKLNSLPSYSRHYNISLIITTQVYNALPVKLRKNVSGLTIARIYNKKDYENIEDEIGANFHDFKKNYEIATEEPYSFLFVDNREMKLYHNFGKLLWAK